MIRIHLVRQEQVSHCDVEARCLSVDVEVPELERLLDLEPQGYGSRWSVVGYERLGARTLEGK